MEMAENTIDPQEEAAQTQQEPQGELIESTDSEAALEPVSAVVPEETVAIETQQGSVEEPIQEEVVNEVLEETVQGAVVNEATQETVLETVVSENPQETIPENAGVQHVEPSDILNYQVIEEAEEEVVAGPVEPVDFSEYTKKDCVDLVERVLASVKSEQATLSDMKNADNVLKEVKPIFDELKKNEKAEAKTKYIAENGSEEGFEFQNDNYTIRFEAISTQIRDAKNEFFKGLEKDRENSLTVKTKLLQDLRELVANEEISPDKNSWNKFKKIQEEWKNAGNAGAGMNQSLWAAYNALVDRYFSNRSIFNELMDLDRKKNQQLKEDLCVRMEALVGQLDENTLTNYLIKEANALFEEYKHVGPAPREHNEKLWQRFKGSLDKLYDVKREQDGEYDKLRTEVLEIKSAMVKTAESYGSFQSDSINEWNAKTKELQELQTQWDAVQGSMPRDKGKEISKHFWAALKAFYHNKTEFFRKLENARTGNLQAKTALCEEVEGYNSTENFSIEASQRVVAAQAEWKTIGHVPEKFKDSIYERFKAACDAFFNAKRSQSGDKAFEDNLAKKFELISRIEADAKNHPDLSKLPELKAEFQAIGFVPKKNMSEVQTKFAEAVNLFVQNSTSVPNSEKQKLMMRTGGSGPHRGGDSSGGKNMDVKKRIAKLEDEIILYRNNIEFFARSKNAASLREEIDKKIAKVQKEIDELKKNL